MVLIYIINIANKKLKEKIEIERKKLASIYERYDNIKKENPTEKDLQDLDELARDLFKERDNMAYNLSYRELAKNYESNIKHNFCLKMSEVMYSKNKIRSEDILEVINLFLEVMEEFKLPKP